MKRGFSLLELVAVVAAAALLVALAVPPLLAAVERSKVGRVVADLRTVEVALEAYRTDRGRYPPVAVTCEAAAKPQSLQLPRELAAGGYLPPQTAATASTWLEDPFQPGCAYKYAAPENYWMNGSLQDDRYPVWVPSDFPACQASGGQADDSPRSPLAWAVWSRGPRAQPSKALNYRAPLAAATWYRKTGDHGVIARYKQRDGASWSTLR